MARCKMEITALPPGRRDRLTPAQRARCMARIRSRDTGIEMALRRALWHKGYRYRKNYAALPGKPDIVFLRYRIAIFCDSEFFHGKDWAPALRERIRQGSRHEFWEEKITRNIRRDNQVNRELAARDWIVLRFWGEDIRRHLETCVSAVADAVCERLYGDADVETAGSAGR